MHEERADEDRGPEPGMDALLPPAMARKAEALGVAKARMPLDQLFVLAVLAGGFIALGGAFSQVAAAGGSALPYGVARVFVGVAFSLGLVLVLVSGAELFTGNALLVMALASRRITLASLLRNWAIVYVGNAVGAVGVAWLVAASGAVGRRDLQEVVQATALAKCSLPFGSAVALGVLCNLLVCLAVWMSFAARSTIDKVAVIVPPIAAFVACGFEHCVANLYLVPVAWWSGVPQPPAFAAFLSGLAAVTLGNVLGGAGLVGTVYWFVFLRPRNGAR